MKKIFYLMLAATIGTAMVACDDDNDSVEVSGISLDKETLDLTVGDTQQLTATVMPENADDKTVVWTSDKPEVVTVNDEGMVEAVAAGEAVVTATTANGKTATCTVTVKSATVEVSGISLDKETLNLTVGETQQLTATVTPEDADDKTVVWTSDKPEVATVNDEGVVTAVAAGEAVVTAAAGEKTATCTVTVTESVKPATAVKTIKIPGDMEGFYTQIDLTRGEDGKVTAIKKEQQTPQGPQGEATEVNITYATDKVTFAYQEWGENYEIEFSLNAEGYVTGAKKFYEGEPDGETVFAYGESNGMLEKISAMMDDEAADIFTATYGDDKNYTTIGLDLEESGELIDYGCVASDVKNDAGVDLNMFMFCYGLLNEVDYAILCGLIPATPNLLESVADGYIEFVTVENENGVASVKMQAEGQTIQECSLDY